MVSEADAIGFNMFVWLIPVSPIFIGTTVIKVNLMPVSNLPTEYSDLMEAFSKTKASQLPPHRPSDCAIELLSGTTPPRGWIFGRIWTWSQSYEGIQWWRTGKGWILLCGQEGCQAPPLHWISWSQWYNCKVPICSTSGSGSIRTIKNNKIFTKLDLCCAYSPTTPVVNGWWHSPLVVVGLANSPSVFQSFINDMIRDMFNQWLTVYIDNILIYSDYLKQHIRHLRAVL